MYSARNWEWLAIRIHEIVENTSKRKGNTLYVIEAKDEVCTTVIVIGSQQGVIDPEKGEGMFCVPTKNSVVCN